MIITFNKTKIHAGCKKKKSLLQTVGDFVILIFPNVQYYVYYFYDWKKSSKVDVTKGYSPTPSSTPPASGPPPTNSVVPCFGL